MEYPDYYVDYLYCFNTLRDFFECHEYGEHLWLDSGRPPFLKGLIQVAVSLYHLESGNLKGSRILWGTASKYLTPSRPSYWGIDIEKIFSDMNTLHTRLPKVNRVKPSDISAFGLPDIYITIEDPTLRDMLQGWSLSTIEED